MTIAVLCRQCRSRLRIPEAVVGTPVQCPSCRAVFTPPPLETAEAPYEGAELVHSSKDRDLPENAGGRRGAARDPNHASSPRKANSGKGVLVLALSGGAVLILAFAALIAYLLYSGPGNRPDQAPTEPDWREYVNRHAKYRIQMPAEPRESTRDAMAGGFRIKVAGSEAVVGDYTYSASFIQMGERAEFSAMDIREGVKAEMRGKVVKEHDDKQTAGFHVHDFQMMTAQPQGYAVGRLVTFRGRVYQLMVSGPDCEAVIANAPKFLDSFDITDELRTAAKIEPFLAVAVDPEAKAVFLTTLDRRLVHYSYPDFKQVRSFDLGTIGYQAVMDRQRGLLYVADSDPKMMHQKPPFGEWECLGQGGLRVYDYKKLIDDPPAGALSPIRTIDLRSTISDLSITADGEFLYYLNLVALRKGDSWKSPIKGSKIVRIEAAALQYDKEIAVADGTDHMCLSPDDKSIYATASLDGHDYYRRDDPKSPERGLVQVIDTADWKVRDRIDIPTDPYYMTADDKGRVFITNGSGQHSFLTVVDTEKKKLLGRWYGFSSFSPIQASKGGDRIYIGRSRDTRPGGIESYSFDGSGRNEPQKAEEITDWAVDCPMSGEFFKSPDGKFLIFRKGGVLRIASR